MFVCACAGAMMVIYVFPEGAGPGRGLPVLLSLSLTGWGGCIGLDGVSVSDRCQNRRSFLNIFCLFHAPTGSCCVVHHSVVVVVVVYLSFLSWIDE